MAKSKVAVVTGANKGIGLAIVRALCKRFKGDVYLTARDPKLGEASVKKLKEEEGLMSHFHQLDITNLQSITRLRDFLKKEFCGIDILINNAGIAFKGRVVNVSSILSQHALASCSKYLLEKFRSDTITEDELVTLMEKFVEDTKKGIHSQEGWPHTAYGVSKIGVTVLSMIQAKKLNEERGADGILLNTCCPGWIRTEMGGDRAPKSPDQGAETPVYLALLPRDADGPHGQFVCGKKLKKW